MIFYVLSIGALTSKPYAFTARSWELNSVESIDFFDSLGSNIRIDTRGSEIMRILPKINNRVNEEWISDKIRFSYDGLKQQRLNNPMLRVNGKLENVDWPLALKTLADKIKNLAALEFVLGNFVDLETQVVLKLLAKKVGASVSVNDLSIKNVDFRGNYLLNFSIEDLSKIDIFFLIGCNLRFENPVLNLKIRKRVNEGALVFTFGNNCILDYPTINLGSTVKDLISILEGKHPLAGKLLKSKMPAIFVGAAIEQRIDSNSIFNAVKILENYLCKKCVSSLIVDVAKLNSFELNFLYTSNILYKYDSSKVIYILASDNICLDSNSLNFIVYQGHHGDRIAARADLVLPSATPFEKIATYVNLNGIYQTTKFVYAPPGNSRTDWKILKAIADVSGIGLDVNNIKELRNLTNSLVVENKTASVLALSEKDIVSKIYNNSLAAHIEDYYLNDNILRSSYIMALSSNRFNKKINFNK